MSKIWESRAIVMAVSLYKQMKGRWTMIKQVSLALAALGLSASAYAAHPVEDMLPAAPPTVAVTIPQQTGSWVIGVEALYQAPGNGDPQYAITATANGPTTLGNLTTVDAAAKVHNVDPEHDWGWQLDLAYLFAGNGRDVELSWKHLDTSDSDTANRPASAFMSGPSLVTPIIASIVSTNPPVFVNGWDTARGKSDYDYDHVDLVFGQKADFGQKVTLRAFGGLRYAQIDFKDEGYYLAQEVPVNGLQGNVDTAELYARSKSEFDGLGLRAGIDTKVRLGSNFSIVGTFGGSLLVGDRDKSTSINGSYIDRNTGAGVPNAEFAATATIKTSDETLVVPELDARLGINYAWAFNPDAALEIELGYETINYFDVKNTSTLGYFDTIGHDNDFSIRGPYLRLQLNLA